MLRSLALVELRQRLPRDERLEVRALLMLGKRRLVADRLRSPALGRDWDYLAYLPDGHETGRLRYPALYLLHGYGQDRYEWVTKGQVQRLADAMIRDGEIPPCVIVMPSAGTSPAPATSTGSPAGV